MKSEKFERSMSVTSFLEMADEVQPAEPAADDDDPLRHEPFATAACTRSSSFR